MRFVCRMILATLVFGVVTPANATEANHCSYRLVPIASAGAVTTAELELIGCFGTFEEAIEAGAGGTVDVAPGESPQTLTEADVTAAALLGDVLIGTEYNGTGYVGASTSYWAASTCSAVTTWQVSYVGNAVNDTFQSGKGFGGCDTNKKFEHSNFGGAVKTCTPNCTDYGTLSNEVSSLRWRV